MKKIILILVLAALIGGGFFVYQNLGGWVRTEAQRIASDAAGVDVTIGAIQVGFRDKTIAIHDIKVANPKGFETAHALTLGSVKVKAELLSREKIVLKEIVATEELVNLEIDGNRVNLRELLKGVEKRSNEKPKSESSVKAPQLVIKELRIEKGVLNSSIGVLGRKTSNTLNIPTIRMYNLGEGNSSSNAYDVAGEILQKILNEAIQVAAKQGAIQGNVKDVVKGATESLKDIKGRLFRK